MEILFRSMTLSSDDSSHLVPLLDGKKIVVYTIDKARLNSDKFMATNSKALLYVFINLRVAAVFCMHLSGLSEGRHIGSFQYVKSQVNKFRQT